MGFQNIKELLHLDKWNLFNRCSKLVDAILNSCNFLSILKIEL